MTDLFSNLGFLLFCEFVKLYSTLSRLHRTIYNVDQMIQYCKMITCNSFRLLYISYIGCAYQGLISID